MQSFNIPVGPQRSELEIKRSKFIAHIDRVESREDANIILQTLRTEFPDANHHCWAMIAGSPDDTSLYKQSDDGEPSGTAGKPMLNVLQHSGLGKIMVVVIRYFGGIKLGAGGLVRAYTQSVSEAIKTLQTTEHVKTESVKINLPYSLLDSLEHWLHQTEISISEKQFETNITLTLCVPYNEITVFIQKLGQLGHGTIKILSRSDQSNS